jgi:hypothetical protein
MKTTSFLSAQRVWPFTAFNVLRGSLPLKVLMFSQPLPGMLSNPPFLEQLVPKEGTIQSSNSCLHHRPPIVVFYMCSLPGLVVVLVFPQGPEAKACAY